MGKMADSEKEQISLQAVRIKTQCSEIRAMKKIILQRVSKMEEPEEKKMEDNRKKPGTASRTPKPKRKMEVRNHGQRPRKRRQRDAVVFKLKNNMTLSKRKKNYWQRKLVLISGVNVRTNMNAPTNTKLETMKSVDKELRTVNAHPN